MEDRAKAIQRRSLGEQAYGYLCDLITEGRMEYGRTLNIKLLAKELNVSPMPVREALKRLEAEGLVTIKPQSGCVLRPPTTKSIADAIAMQEVLETYCVRSVLTSVDLGRLEPLRELAERMAGLRNEEPFDQRKFFDYDARFRAALCALASNEFIDKAYRETRVHLRALYSRETFNESAISATYRENMELVAALASRSEAAADLIGSRYRRIREAVLRFPSAPLDP